jgi:hypothetical protein
VSFYDDSLLRPLSSRTVHYRLALHHCRNSSVLSVLSALLALFRCACVVGEIALQPLGLLYTLFSRSSHCRRHMSLRPTRRERSKRREGEIRWAIKSSREFCLNAEFHVTFRDLFTCRKSTTWDRRLYIPSEGRRAGDFFAL